GDVADPYHLHGQTGLSRDRPDHGVGRVLTVLDPPAREQPGAGARRPRRPGQQHRPGRVLADAVRADAPLLPPHAPPSRTRAGAVMPAGRYRWWRAPRRSPR